MKRLLSLLLVLAGSAPVCAQTNSLVFTPLAALPDGGRYAMAYCQDQTYFYMVGGGSPQTAFTSEVFRYDPAANSWGATPLSTGQVPEHRLAKAVLLNPGTGSARLYVLNGATIAGPMPAMFSLLPGNGTLASTFSNDVPANQAGLATWNGRLYAYGGLRTNGTFTNELRSFDPATGVWTALAPMPEAKNTYGAAVNGKIYAVGGYNGVVNSARVDAYDIATNQWQALGTLPTTVSNQAVAVQGEWLWLVGDFTNQSYLAAYNTRTGQLRTFTSNLPPRRNAAAVIHNNHLYVWGGNTAASNASTLADMWQTSLSGVLASPAARRLPQLAVYPNPSVSGEFTLKLPAGTRSIEVRDALGRRVQTVTPPAQAGTYQLQLGTQPAGVYTVRVRTGQGWSAPSQLLRQ
ncbi:kelch repeat-containing protein [Hymenobacter sp. B81]|uniref:Kelch repeat-containing protein n=1 Tax=Hymenobacter sp. B81 TaxID=3344878 RepID=UPI0037DDAF4D